MNAPLPFTPAKLWEAAKRFKTRRDAAHCCGGRCKRARNSETSAAAGAARMIPFFVQIKCKLGKSYEVANALADSEIASEIYSTAGEFDLLAKFYVDEGTDIGHFVNEKVQVVPGIQDTRTIITFKAFG